VTTETVQNTVANIRNCVHPRCVVCSSANAKGLYLKCDVDDDGSVKATFQCDESFEGYPDVMHGGAISSILDGAMDNCMFARGQATVTAEMTTRFQHPIVTGRKATFSARITQVTYPLYLLEAEIIQDGKVKAIAKGKYYDQPKLIDSDGVTF
jgi:uncharacterized protein (TIGR00369 family)